MNSKQFKAVRIAKAMTQQEFGELLGFSKKWARMRVSEIERGDKAVSRKTAILCQMLLKSK